MTEAWHIPPLPKHGDKTDSQTYEAVGRALTRWEQVEIELGRLYAIATDRSQFDLEAMAEYGKAAVFTQRMDDLEKAVAKFFVRHSNQEAEAQFCSLAAKVRGFALRRNDIAHGVVRSVRFVREASGNRKTVQQFVLTPPHYHGRRHVGPFPVYMLNAAIIGALENQFHGLALEVASLRRWLLQLA